MYERKSPKKRGSEEYFEAVLETIPEGIVLMDKNHRVVTTNSTFKEMFDYNDLKGKDIDDFIIPEKLIEEGKRCTSRVMNGEVVHFDSVRKTKEGKELFVSILGAPVVVDGEQVGVFAIYRDISERKKMEELHKSLSEFNKELLEHAPIGIMRLNKEMEIEYVNPKMKRILGLPFGKEYDASWEKIRETLFVKETEISPDMFDALANGERVSQELSFTLSGGGDGCLTFEGVPLIENNEFTGAVLLFDDISDRKETERELRKKHNAIENAIVGFAFSDMEGNIKYANPELLEMLGYEEREIVGNHVMEFVENGEQTKEVLEKLRERGAWKGEITVRRKDGSKLETLCNTSLIKNDENSPIGLVNTIIDITERKKMEEELRESEQKYRSIVENAHSGILIIDENYTCTYANDKLCEILGYPREEIIGYDFRGSLDEASTQLVTDRYIRRQQGEDVPSRYEFNIIRKDGEKRRVEVRSSVIKDPEGKPKTVAQILDITKRKKAEQELEETKQRLELALEGAELGVWDWNVKTGDVQFDERWVEMLGYGLNEIEHKLRSWEERVHPDDLPKVEKELEKHLRGETEIYKTEHRVKTKSGDWKWIKDIGKIVERDEEGNPARAVGVHEDITERKKAEKGLKKQKEELSEFAHTVSHDLKNYINIIKNRAQLSLMKEETAKTNATKIVDITEEMEKFVSRQLELADAGKAIGKPEKVDLNELLEEVSENHELAVKWEDLPIIEGDPQRLKEMFHNLIENAVIHGEATRVELTAEQGEDAPIISVKDNGKGIPEEHLDKIFDMGYSTDGFGVGLSIVKRIVEAHGWSIGVESAEEEGTTFTLTFSRDE